MKGITIGEIGNKVGFNTSNNGFLAFDHVRIPLKNMLMKNSRVLEDGQFVKEKSPLLTYGVMTLVRVGIVRIAQNYLSKAVTIAMRYATVRRQSPIDPDAPEPKIIEHVTQQMKIFPALAKVFAFKAAAQSLSDMEQQFNLEIEKGDISRLPELHALSCCLKALCTDEAVQAIQTCRLACGGHGYLNSSGFNDIYGNVVAAQHYEGENTIMYLQTARFLVKAWNQALNGQKLTPTVAYLKNYVNKVGKRELWDGSLDGILRAFQASVAGKIGLLNKHFEEKKKFCSPEEATNQTGIERAQVAELHCQAFLLQSIIQDLEASARNVSLALGEVFRDLIELFAVDLTIRSLSSLLQVKCY